MYKETNHQYLNWTKSKVSDESLHVKKQLAILLV